MKKYRVYAELDVLRLQGRVWSGKGGDLYSRRKLVKNCVRAHSPQGTGGMQGGWCTWVTNRASRRVDAIAQSLFSTPLSFLEIGSRQVRPRHQETKVSKVGRLCGRFPPPPLRRHG